MKTTATPRLLTTLLCAGLLAGGLILGGLQVSGKGKPSSGPSYQIVQLDHVGSDFDYYPN